MLEQYIPYVNADDVERLLRREFSKEDVLYLLPQISKFEPRDIAACLKNSRGKFDTFCEDIFDKTRDWRDSICQAEYPNYTEEFWDTDINRFSLQEIIEIIEKDKAQYLEWFNKK